MEIRYQFLIDENLLIQKYSGEFSINDFKSYIGRVTNLPESGKILKILSDFRDLNMDDPDDNDLIEMVNIRRNIIKGQYLNVFLLSNPIPTAAMALFIDEIKEEFSYHYCSTMATAINILKLKISIDELETKLRNL